MSKNIAVIYEKGVLRPLRPLNIPEHTRLKIRIMEPGDDGMTEAEKAYQVLVQAGLIRPSSPSEVEPVSESERLQAADEYGQAGPLSDLIIAERDNG
jgi:predicted DNA-binding antitoxin AbrB/MazE fold protein